MLKPSQDYARSHPLEAQAAGPTSRSRPHQVETQGIAPGIEISLTSVAILWHPVGLVVTLAVRRVLLLLAHIRL